MRNKTTATTVVGMALILWQLFLPTTGVRDRVRVPIRIRIPIPISIADPNPVSYTLFTLPTTHFMLISVGVISTSQ